MGRVSVGLCGKVSVKRKDVCHQVALKLLHVSAVPFAAHEFLPCLKQVFHGSDILVGMNKLNSGHAFNAPPPTLLPVLQRVKDGYILWYGYYQILPKLHRHTLGQRIDTLFIEIMESIATAGFLQRQEKQPYVRLAIRKTDTLKILLMVLWETKSLDNKKYIALSIKIDEIGRMLGGWNGQLVKQNSPDTKPGEK